MERQTFAMEEAILEDDPMAAFCFIERLLENAQTDLAPFSNQPIGLGLDFIFSNNHSNLANDFKSAAVPFVRKEKAIRSLFFLFRDVLNPRCDPQTSAGENASVSTLNNICYMFWDVCLWCTFIDLSKQDELLFYALENLKSMVDSSMPEGVQELLMKHFEQSGVKKLSADEILTQKKNQYANLSTESRGYYEAIAYVMQECLKLSNPACVESGLHGLGHLVPFMPDIAVPIIDQYLKNKKNPNEQLVNYAQAARTGMIL